MKARNYLTILFAVVAIIVLIALAGFMTIYVADDSNPLRQQIMQVISPEESSENIQPASEIITEQAETAALKAHSFLFVGDSRTIGMGDAVNDNCTYIGAEGEGYDWFSSEGAELLEEALAEDPARDVIFNFGVNDPKNVNLYIDFYHSLMQQYPDTSFYFLSVNPLTDSEGFNTTNEMIALFNATIRSAFPDNYLDSFSYLTDVGYETLDGLHYTDDTYQKIHDYVVDSLLD